MESCVRKGWAGGGCSPWLPREHAWDRNSRWTGRGTHQLGPAMMSICKHPVSSEGDFFFLVMARNVLGMTGLE